MKKIISITALMIFTFSLTSCNSMKFAKAENLTNIRAPFEDIDYQDTEKEFYSIQSVKGEIMGANRAEARGLAKSDLGSRIAFRLGNVESTEIATLNITDEEKQQRIAFNQKLLSASQQSVAKLMLVDSKNLREKEGDNYVYWVVFKIILDDVVEVINQSDLGFSITPSDLLNRQ